MNQTCMPHVEGYLILDKIGEGGMAQVWRARQISLDRIVALKVLPAEREDDVVSAEQFRLEGQAAARLKHPGIVQVYDAETQGGLRYIVMEHVNGYSVGDWIRRKGRLSAADALTITEQVALALKYAWEKAGIVHCDLKPDNILIDEDGTVKVADLGSVQMLGAAAHEHRDFSEGTPSYMAPEQIVEASDLDCRADIYALGATLYHMVVGERPFGNTGVEGVLEKRALGESGIDPSRLALMPQVSGLIAKMTAQRREDRMLGWSMVLEQIGQTRSSIGPALTSNSKAGHGPKGAETRPRIKIRVPSAPGKSGGSAPVESGLRPRRAGYKFGRLVALIGVLAAMGVIVFLVLREANNQSRLAHLRQMGSDGSGGLEPLPKKNVPGLAIPAVPVKDRSTDATHLVVSAVATQVVVATVMPDSRLVMVSPPDVLQGSGWKARLLWQAGKLNGYPRNQLDGLIADEYKRLTAEEPVVHIRKPDEFVQAIRPRQVFVVHLGALPAHGCVLRIAITSGSQEPAEDIRYQFCDATKRVLRVAWNNQLLWRRWVAPGHSTIEILVPAAVTSRDDNLLTMENEGAQGLCFDAVWLLPFVTGPRMFAAFEDASWVGAAVAQRAPVCALNLPPPVSEGPSDPDTSALGLPRQAPREVREAIAAWPTLSETNDGLPKGTNILALTVKRWDTAIRSCLQRGMLPVVSTTAAGNPALWRLWAQRFGPLVAYWVLSGPSNQVAAVTKEIHGRVANAQVIWNASPDCVSVPGGTTGLQSVMIHRRSGYWGGRTDSVPGALRTTTWGKGLPGSCSEPFDQWLSVRPPVCALDFTWQRKQVWGLAEAIVQWWMAGGNKMIVEGGDRGDFVFPGEIGQPTLSWDALRLLLPLGENRAERSFANLIPTEAASPLSDTFWATANNSRSLVTMVVYAEHDSGRTVEAQVPVPWTGPTTVATESLQLHGRAADPEPATPTNLQVRTRGPWEEVVGERTQNWSVATFPLTLSSVHLLRLTPAGFDVPFRSMAASRTLGSVDIPLVRGLFHILETPLAEDARLVSVRAVDWPVDRLCQNYQRVVESATPGVVPAWKMTTGVGGREIVPVRNVVPWTPQSDVVLLPAVTGKENRPQGIRLLWDTTALATANEIVFWVRVSQTAPARSASTMRSLEARKCPVLVGTDEKLERLILAPDTWQILSAPVRFLRLSSGGLSPHLTVRADPEAKKPLRCEINTILGVCREEETRRPLNPVTGFLQWDHKQGEILVALLGASGKAGWWHCRLPEPIRIRGMSVETARSSTDTAGNPASQDRNVVFQYHEKSQVLEVGVKSFPSAADQAPAAVLRHFFSDFPKSQTGSESAFFLRFLLDKGTPP